MQASPVSADPRYHTAAIKEMLRELISRLRDDARHVTEPKAQALFETSAEVLKGLETAFTHYEKGSEPGMRR